MDRPILARAALRDAFERDGYLKVESLFSADEMAGITATLDEFLRHGVGKMPPEQVYYEDPDDPQSIKQLQKLFDYDEVFRDLMFDGPPRALAELALGEPVCPVNMQYFNKPPGIGQATPPHQDGYFFHLMPPRAVTGWLALEPVDAENGCIHYVRGSHLVDGFRNHAPTGVLGFSQGITDFGSGVDIAGTVAEPGEAGTFLLHHAKTIHWAGANTSPTRSRRAVGFIYYGESAEEDTDTKAAYQAALDARLRDEGRIR